MVNRVVIVAVLLVFACNKSEGHSTSRNSVTKSAEGQSASQESAPAPAEEQKAEPSPFDELMTKTSLPEAIGFAMPYMTDTMNENSKGALLLGAWSAKNLQWTELASVVHTRISLVMKDPEAHRGQRLCGTGSIIEIQADSTPWGKVFLGGMFTDGGIIRFIAARSTGDLVQGSYARYCGIVVGKFDYSNSAGGTAHAIGTVGMFELPENTASPSLQMGSLS